MNQKYTLKELRARKNKTQIEAAKDLNISTATYNSWENKPKMIKLSNVLKLCNYYGININELKI